MSEVRELAGKTEEDPVVVNDNPRLYELLNKYESYGVRGPGKLRRSL